MQQHIHDASCGRQQFTNPEKNSTFFISFKFISPGSTMLPGQELAPSPLWEGCQWVIEPVSRHFFINQTGKGMTFIANAMEYCKYILSRQIYQNIILNIL
jgi:hypothetical protein